MAGGCTRTRPTAPEAASTYHGPVSPRMTPEPDGSVAAEAAAKTRGSPGTRHRQPACQRAWPRLHQQAQHLGDLRRRHIGARVGPAAQQARQLADGRIRLLVGGDPVWRGRGDGAAALADHAGW